MTKAQLIKQGDKICAKADRKQLEGFSAYVKDHPKAASSEKEKERAIVAVGLPPVLAEAHELAALNPPAADADRIDEIVKGIEQALKKVEADPLSSNLVEPENPFTDADQKARAYGFKVCSDAL